MHRSVWLLTLVILTLGCMVAAASAAQGAVLVGDTSLEAFNDNNPANNAQAWSYTASATGTATDIEFYAASSNAATKITVGLYSDASGKPGNRLTTGSTSTVHTGAWNDITVPATNVTVGTKYWLAVSGSGGTPHFLDKQAGTCTTVGSTSAMPSPWGTNAWSATGWCPASFYLNGTLPAPPPTAAFTASPNPSVTGQSVTFDGSKSTCNATPCSYRYFDSSNNATLGTSQTSSFTFQSVGTKYVNLTVTDAKGQISTVEHDQTVNAPSTTAPSNTSPPTISGTPQQGQTLTANPGTWNGNPSPTFTYAWSDGATGQTDTLGASDVGKTVTVTVTGTNSAGSAQVTSGAVGPVTASGSSGGCDLNANTSNFTSQVAAATSGQTICLASGSYGTFNGANKSGMVTIQPATGATVDMSLNFNGAANLTLTGMTIDGALIEGASHDLTISHDTVSPGIIHLLTDQFNHANILIDHDSFPNTIATGGQGRVWTDYNSVNTTNNIGVTVSNSQFTGGDMIDILIEGGAGLQVLNNEFTGMNNTINEAIHSDTIFNYGDQGGNVIKGNWFHDQVDVPACGWAQWDGGWNNVFENNVISHAGGPTGTDGCYESMAVLNDSNSIIAHNVIEPGTGESGPIGQIDLGGKTSEGAGSGTIIRDNTLGFIANGDGGLNATFNEDHNLCAGGCSTTGDQGSGTGDITGSPTWVGGNAPTTFNGFALASGSLGVGAASDGTNMGVELPTGG